MTKIHFVCAMNIDYFIAAFSLWVFENIFFKAFTFLLAYIN